jgi:hypothetical protein
MNSTKQKGINSDSEVALKQSITLGAHFLASTLHHLRDA